MKTIIPLVIFFLLVAGNAFSQEDSSHKTQQHRHMEYSKTKNPIPVTSQSVEKGGEIYKKHCAVCHGDKGKGKVGPDLTADILLHGNTDGEIFKVISDGVKGTAMKGFKKELAEKMRWHLVNYIKSLRKSLGKEVKSGTSRRLIYKVEF